MKPRTKSISTAAVIFGFDALILLVTAFVRHLLTGQQHGASMLRVLLILAFAVCFAIVAYGLWRLLPWARRAGCVLSGVSLFYLAIKLSSPLTGTAAYGGAEWFGVAIGIVICILWFGSPLYFLTRASSVAAFNQARSSQARQRS